MQLLRNTGLEKGLLVDVFVPYDVPLEWSVYPERRHVANQGRGN